MWHKIIALALIAGALFLSIPMSYAKLEHRNIIWHDYPVITPARAYSFRVTQNFCTQVEDTVYCVPQGFITDLASIPKLFWALWAPHEAALIAPSILHDYLYSGLVKIDRAESDLIFYWHMREQGISKWRAYLFYKGVRWFGAKAFVKE